MEVRATLVLALVVLATIGETLVLARQASHLHEWAQYKRQHGKVYESPEEDARRFSLFLAAKERVQRHNANERASYKLGLNHMSDWTQEEFAQLTHSLGSNLADDEQQHETPKRRRNAGDPDPPPTPLSCDTAPVPAAMDYRKVPNRVSAVKDQGKCNSGWAFATVGVLEGQQFFTNYTNKPSKSIVPLSAQQLIDCSTSNKGCSGGDVEQALLDAGFMGGVQSEKDYPYGGVDKQQCHFNREQATMQLMGVEELSSGDLNIKQCLNSFGPVATSVEPNENFREYKSGIFSDPACGHLKSRKSHSVLIVGYGTDPEEGDYWIVKNSWSTSWGENGYMRIKAGLCGIGEFSNISWNAHWNEDKA
uniref:Cathepsin L n=1 Tax=Aceria tosichella TaxID=561515 RepID=A0A6G1SGW0_9ACAR